MGEEGEKKISAGAAAKSAKLGASFNKAVGGKLKLKGAVDK
jgi:hypothetical protein